MVEPSLDDPEVRKRLSGPAFVAFVETVSFLHLDELDALRLLGNFPSATYSRYVAEGAPELDRDILERISLVLGIAKALRQVFADDESARRWLQSDNAGSPFEGRSPLACAQGSSAGLYAVRTYVDGWQGGWP